MIADETEIVQPFLLGCDTKSLRVVQISLTGLQRLINNEALSEVCIYQIVLGCQMVSCLLKHYIFNILRLMLSSVSMHGILDNDL